MSINLWITILFSSLYLTSCKCFHQQENFVKAVFPKGINPIAPYSPGVVVDNMLFIGGQIAIDPYTSSLVVEDIEKETHQVLKNLFQIVKEAGFEPNDLVKITIFMTDIAHYEVINRVYAEYFKEVKILPAREAVAVKSLPRNVNVEISAIAVKSKF